MWQLIDTAPKDSANWVLVYGEDGVHDVAVYDNGSWINPSGLVLEDVELWMPFPNVYSG